MKKKLFLAAGFIFFIFLGWRIILLVMNPETARRQDYMPSIGVEVYNVSRKPIKQIREFTGTLAPIYRYIIAPKVSGRVVEITKRIGDWVNKGEIIARIDDAEYQQAVLEAEANLRSAKASLNEAISQFELAKQELERERSLEEKGISSSSELDAAETTYAAQQSRLELARAQVQQREASLNSARIRLDYTVLTATEPGYIGERYVDEGNLLSSNSPLVSVIGIDTIIVETTIIERDYGNIHIGQSSEVEVDAFPEMKFIGTVARIAPVLQEASRVAKMEVEVENSQNLLKPGMFARVRVVLQQKDSAQVVPNEAIIIRNEKEGIFVIDRNKSTNSSAARFYPIETGIISGRETEILSPEIKGPVVILGQHLLEDGSNVIINEPDDISTSTNDALNFSESNREIGR